MVRERRGELLSIREGSVCRPRRRLAGAYERGELTRDHPNRPLGAGHVCSHFEGTARRACRVPQSPGYEFAIVIDGEAAGGIGLVRQSDVERLSAEIGYWIGRPFWGQGLIPEAVRELLRYCFEDKGAQRVWCSHYAGNEKSKRVIEKCGFSYQLTCERPALVDDALRPTLFYALTKEKWEKTR